MPSMLGLIARLDKTEGVTASIRAVQGEACSRWDKELNRVYAELLNNYLLAFLRATLRVLCALCG